MLHRHNQQTGNALFLILIAVALFAALSYAITQSGRGGGSIEKEQMAINVAVYQQYLYGIDTAIDRMMITGSTISDIVFYNTPNDHSSGACTSGQHCIFAPEGGGVTYLRTFTGKENLAASLTYQKNANFTSFGTASGQDLHVLGFGVTLAECEYINKQLGVAAVGVGLTDNGLIGGEVQQCQAGPPGTGYGYIYFFQTS